MSLEEAVKVALAVEAPPDDAGSETATVSTTTGPPGPDGSSQPVARAAGRGAAPAGLSPREVEVLGLIAAGRTSKEIADALVLSIRTVERHITHVYEKIGAREYEL
jgi:DNA-binding CsgD family transcriptional regulator